MTGQRPSVEDWLQDVLAAAAEFEHLLDAGQMPALRPVPLPVDTDPAALPAALAQRARHAKDHLLELMRRAEERRDEVAAQLAKLPRARPKPSAGYTYEIGTTLDVAG